MVKGYEMRQKILQICKTEFVSLGEFCQILGVNQHTLRASYLYKMAEAGTLEREHPAGTRSKQRYRAKSQRRR